MYQVVVLPPADALGDVEGFRRRHDPAFHRVGAHVPLLPSFDGARELVLYAFAAYRGGAPFRVSFGAPESRGSMLCLPVADGADAVRQLRLELAELLLDSLHARPVAAPYLRVGVFASDAELELARRSLGVSEQPAPFEVTDIVLLLEDARGIWHEVSRQRLAD